MKREELIYLKMSPVNCMHLNSVSDNVLIHLISKLVSYRNQSIDLHFKSTSCFLYDEIYF